MSSLTTGGALHKLPDQWYLLGPPNPPTPQTTGRPEADPAAQILVCSQRGLTAAASQVRINFSLQFVSVSVQLHKTLNYSNNQSKSFQLFTGVSLPHFVPLRMNHVNVCLVINLVRIHRVKCHVSLENAPEWQHSPCWPSREQRVVQMLLKLTSVYHPLLK